jgi:prevent-host-death family protein
MRKPRSILPEDITPLTDFKRDTAAYIRKLRKTGRAQVLTVNGRAEVVVQSAKSYQKTLEFMEDAATVNVLKQRLADVDRGIELLPPREAVAVAKRRRTSRKRTA